MVIPGEFHILFVCTGNICRSPLAELLTRRLLPSPVVSVASAGCQALQGHGVDPLTARELSRRGVPEGLIAAHRARQVEPDMLAAADLVLTADRTHRAHVARLYPPGLSRTFCLREFHRLLTLVDPRGPAAQLPRMHAMVKAAAAARGTTPPVPHEADTIVDPYGHPPDSHHTCATTIATLLEDILTVMTPKRPPSPEHTARTSPRKRFP